MSKQITIFQPGKLFLAGEYAVTKSPNSSIIISLDLGLILTIKKTQRNVCSISNEQASITFKLTDLSHDLTKFPKYWHFALSSVFLIKQLLPNLSNTSLKNFEINISSQMIDKNQNKLGLGSSAAVTSGIINLLTNFYNLNFSALERFKLAAIAHYWVQQKGSLGDVASSIFRGVIFYQAPDNDFLKNSIELDAHLAFIDWPNLIIKNIFWPNDWQVSILPTFQSASTTKHLAKQQLSDNFYLTSSKLVNQLVDSISTENFAKTKEILQTNQTLLISNLNAGYMTNELEKRLLFFSKKNNYICKISGAGYGDNAILITQKNTKLIDHPFLEIKSNISESEAL